MNPRVQYRWIAAICFLPALFEPALAQDDALDELFSSDAETTAWQDTQDSESGDENEPARVQETGDVEAQPIVLPEGASPSSTRQKSRNRLVEEIVVTAQKREESLQDVPISIQAFSGEKLDAMGITDQTDLQRVTPGLNVTNQVSYVMTFLRGIGTDATIAADPSVATYIDGIYYPFASNLAQNFGSVDRIEVLKGPQGTLFGRNATGGAIAIYTQEPDFEEVHGEIVADVGGVGHVLARAHVNLPLSDDYALSATALQEESDGYYSGFHDTPSRPIHGNTSTGVRLKFRAQPNDKLDIRLAGLHMEMELGTAAVGFNATPSLLGQLQGIQAQDGYHGTIDARVLNDTDANTVYYGSASYALPWLDFKLIGSDQRMDTQGIRDFDGSPQALSTLATPNQFIDAQSMELQLLSNGELGPDWLQWIAGAFVFRAKQGFGELDFIVNGIDLAAGTAAGIAIPAPLVSLFGGPLPTGSLNLVGMIGTDSRALFTQATIQATDWLDITLGGRYQVEERWIIESTVGLNNADGSVTPVLDNSDSATDTDGNSYPAHDTARDFSPKLSLQFRPFDDDTMIYASWQQAVKAATYNAVAITGVPDYVAPEELEAFEVGIKTRLFGGLTQFNAAAFKYDVENLQTYYLSTQAGGVISFQNAAAADILGFEFDLATPLFPALIDQLVLTGGAAWLDTEYASFPNGSGFDENGTFQQGQDWTGNQLIRTAELTMSWSLAKAWDMTGGPIEAVFDAYYTDDFFYEASNREASRQEGYWLFGARLSYLYEPWDIRATVGVRNLTDKFYTAGFFATDYGIQPNLAPPRSYNLQLIWRF